MQSGRKNEISDSGKFKMRDKVKYSIKSTQRYMLWYTTHVISELTSKLN